MRSINDFHPITMLVYFMAVIVPTMFFADLKSLAVSGVAAVFFAAVVYRKNPAKDILFILVCAAVMGIVNALTVSNGEKVIIFINDRAITLESFLYGIKSGIMLAVSIIWFKIFSYYMTSERIRAIFYHMPKTGLLISMVMRLVPEYVQRYKKVAALNKNSSKQGIVNNMSAVFSWAVESSAEKAQIIKMRDYGKEKNRYSPYSFKKKDAVVTVMITVLAAGYVFVDEYKMILWICGIFLPLFYTLKERAKWKLYTLRK